MNSNYLVEARDLERQNLPSRAFENYCRAIENSEPFEVNDYLNFSFLSFLFQDYGYSSSHNINPKNVELAWVYMEEALLLCEAKYGLSPVTSFWKKYYKTILFGESIDKLALSKFIDAGVHEAVFLLPIKERLGSDVEKLKSKFDPPQTAKDRYLLSIC